MELLRNVTIDKSRTDYELPNILQEEEFEGVDASKLIFIYYLKTDMISYPNRNGNVIYIGRAIDGDSMGLGGFTHISPSVKEGEGDTNLNYALSSYYERSKKIELRIFKVPRIYDCHYIEELLIKYHMNTFGCHPIAQGHSGYNNSPQYLEQIISESQNSNVKQILNVMEN